MKSITKVFSDIVKPYIDKTASTSADPKTVSYADIVSIKDGAGVLAKDVSIKIEPVQAGSGTPSPSNVRAISGRDNVKVTRCGKNLLNPNVTTASTEAFKVFGGTAGTNYPDGTLTLNAGTYTVSISAVMERILIRDDNADIVSDSSNTSFLTFTISRRTAIKVGLQKSGDIWNTLTYQLECGSTATEHEPYTGNDYTIDLGGTIYGGTLDVTSGKLTVDRIFKEYDGTETWVESGTFSNTYFVAYPSGVSNSAAANQEYGMCNAYAHANPSVSLGTQNNAYLLGASLNIRDTVNGTSLSDWTNYVANHHLQFIFPLATPQVIQLTPTQIRMLAGVNTVYANTGDTQVEYFNASVGNLGEVLGDVQGTVLNEVTTRAQLGAHNLGKKYNGVTSIGITIKDAPDGGNYVNGTATGSGGRLNLKSDNFVLKAGTYSIIGESNDHSKYSSVVLQKTSDNSVLGSYSISNGIVDKSQATVTLAEDTECYFGFNTSSGTAYGTDTFIIYPMVKLADDKDDTFYPYSKSNVELTEDISNIKSIVAASSDFADFQTRIANL